MLPDDIRLSGRTVVIGGGNVAIDVARTALRAGSESVGYVLSGYTYIYSGGSR